MAQKLNQAQQQAVDTIFGPLLVIAGPGTGKTELLARRAAEILQKTDTLPSNILCITFTDSGAIVVRHGDKVVGRLEMDFLHDGCPRMMLEARWTPPAVPAPARPRPGAPGHADGVARHGGA